MRIGFFLGAGCATSIRVERGGLKEALIPNIVDLTKKIRVKMSTSAEHRPHFDSILKQLGDSTSDPKTIEQVLTRLRALHEILALGTAKFEGSSAEDLRKLDRDICSSITDLMQTRLPTSATPYHNLASWIGSIQRAHPVEVFTSNYDLLMEQAFEDCRVPYFDGFSGSDRTFFDVPSMEQLNLPSRWARLWKVHGSINWWKTKDGRIQRRQANGSPDDLQMIHPSHLKYEESRKMPYLAMQDRLRSFLSRGQAVLVTCGYSFLDSHINQAILDGLGGNPTAVCFGLVWGDKKSAANSIARVGHRGNMRLLGVDGGVLGTIDQDWHSAVKPGDRLHGLAVVDGSLGSRTAAPDARCKFLLGDFDALGKFLADQLAQRVQDGGETSAP